MIKILNNLRNKQKKKHETLFWIKYKHFLEARNALNNWRKVHPVKPEGSHPLLMKDRAWLSWEWPAQEQDSGATDSHAMWSQCGLSKPVTRGGNTGFKESDHSMLKFGTLGPYCNFLSSYPRRPCCPEVCCSENLVSYEVERNSPFGVDPQTDYG